ncbi:MAG: response regulator [Syntrophomonadaceae bacterium]|nr:response regulator [Syntrophomonadaceae bacterium]
MVDLAILCVDDEQIILTSLELQLKKHFGNQFMYEFAESAGEAMEIIDDLAENGIRIVLIVSDWLMPGTKGDEFLINVHQQHPEVVKVMLTGQADLDAIEKTRNQADLHCCLYKPWTEEELKEAIVTGVERINGK